MWDGPGLLGPLCVGCDVFCWQNAKNLKPGEAERELGWVQNKKQN
jgi:hypothetical protein